jgi:putative ABC transport system permease protein
VQAASFLPHASRGEAALGATGPALFALVVERGLRQAAWGCAIGLAVSVAGGRVLDSLLFETSPHEPVVLIGTAGALAGLVAVASYLPARVAGRLDPAAVLRTD